MTQHPAVRQLNVELGPPMEEGRLVEDVLDPVPWPDSLVEGTWYALVPSHIRDQTRVASAATEYDPEEIPVLDDAVFDCKYLPLLDLIHSNGDDVLVSERLAEVLAKVVRQGLEFEFLPHATPVPVSGHRWFRMRTSGWLGPLTDTRLMPVAGDPSPTIQDGRNPRRLPLHPIALDPREWTGDELCWSPWFGVVSANFRLPLVRGSTLAALKRAIPDLSCGSFEVRMKGQLPAVTPRSRQTVFVRGPLPSPITLAEAVKLVRARASHHELHPGASVQDLQHLADQAPFALPESYLELLKTWNGFRLFPDEYEWMRLLGLELWSVGPNGHRSANAAELPEYGNYRLDKEWFLFGQDVQENVLWALDEQGLVRGLGKEGIVYGPDVSFEVWFGDMIRDLDWAWDHQGSEIADTFLGRSGRM